MRMIFGVRKTVPGNGQTNIKLTPCQSLQLNTKTPLYFRRQEKCLPELACVETSNTPLKDLAGMYAIVIADSAGVEMGLHFRLTQE